MQHHSNRLATHDLSRFVGRTLHASAAGTPRPCKVIAAGLAGVVLRFEGRDDTVPVDPPDVSALGLVIPPLVGSRLPSTA